MLVYSFHYFVRKWWLLINASFIFPFISSNIWMTILPLISVFLAGKFLIPLARDFQFPDKELPNYIAKRSENYTFNSKKEYIKKQNFELLIFLLTISFLWWVTALNLVTFRTGLYAAVCFTFTYALYKNYTAAESFWTIPEAARSEDFYINMYDEIVRNAYGPIGQLLGAFGKRFGELLPSIWNEVCKLLLTLLGALLISKGFNANGITKTGGFVELLSFGVFLCVNFFFWILLTLLKGDECLFGLRLGATAKYLSKKGDL